MEHGEPKLDYTTPKWPFMALFWGSTGLKYVYLHPVSPLGNRENTLIKNPQLRDQAEEIYNRSNDFYL